MAPAPPPPVRSRSPRTFPATSLESTSSWWRTSWTPGNTLSYLLKLLAQRKPASIRLCTLLDKPERRTKPVEVHYSGFTIPDAFVVGYGLDYAEHYRNLPYIGILKPEVYGG